jgi:nucleotide-binding universal stress UspA family protein
MQRTVIWATDGSDGAEAALEGARRLGVLVGARIVALHVDQRLDGRAAGWPVHADERDRRVVLAERVSALQADGVDIELVVHKSHREAADVVSLEAAERQADLVVCGTRGLGALPGFFLGSFTQRLLHLAPCPVLAVREAEVRVRSAEAHRVGAHA